MKYLRWVETLLKAPESRRQQWVKEIIDGFKESRTGKKDPTKKYLSEVLEKEYELVGVVPGIEYIKMSGPKDELECIWEHPHMNPQLLYKHKELPVFIITGPGLRFNDSMLNEVGMRSDGVRGITG